MSLISARTVIQSFSTKKSAVTFHPHQTKPNHQMMQILASLLVLISITQSIDITEYDLGTKNYDQSVAQCEADGQTLASEDEVLDHLGGALGDDIWTPVYVSASSANDWLQIGGGGNWAY
eukprot:458367_1